MPEAPLSSASHASDYDGGSCPYRPHCSFVQAVVRNPMLMVRYASLHHYCRGNDFFDCARFAAYKARGVPAANLLPDGSLDVTLSDRPQRVLVVDDMPVFRKLMEGIVASAAEGAEIVSASDGHEALAMLARHDVDLVVSDYHMPGMTGGELVKKIRRESNSPDVPVVIFTTETDDRRRKEALSHDRVRWVQKSPDREHISGAIRELLIQGRA